MSHVVDANHGSPLPTSLVSEETETGLDTLQQPLPSVAPEKFIPVDRNQVLERVLLKQFPPEQQRLAGQVIRYMCAIRQVGTARLLDNLMVSYDPFNPDDETINDTIFTPEERRVQIDALKTKVVDLVTSANYIEITQDQIKDLIKQQSVTGFSAEVDLDEYDFHLLFYRGEILDHQLKRTWKRLWLFSQPKEYDAYRRLFLGLKLKPFDDRVTEMMQKTKGLSRKQAEKKVKRLRNHQMLEGVSEHTLHLKVFRRIPRADLRILFPNARIKFNLFDRLWLWFGSGGSAVYALIIAAIKVFTTLVVGLVFLVITLAGAAGAIVRGITSFFNTRTRYMAKLAKNLYFHNIASNQSVLTMLSDDAEEEDIKEAVLTYSLLLKHGFSDIARVRQEAVQFMHDEFNVEVAFDLEDGFEHLKGFGLLGNDPSGAPRLLNLDEAYHHLMQSWGVLPVRDVA